MTESAYRGVLLAAGGSRRFAGPVAKQLVEIDGEPAVRRVARRALESRLERLVVVTGHQAEAVRAALGGLPVEVVSNPRWADGQSGSVKAGVAAAARDAAALIFLPCDQPFLTGELIDGLIARHEADGSAIVAPAWRGRRGMPVLIDASLFGELATITGDTGARQLFARFPVTEVEVVEEAALPAIACADERRGHMLRPRGGPATR